MKGKQFKKELEILGKDIIIGNSNSKQIQEEINKNKKLIEEYIFSGKYTKAEQCTKKLDVLQRLYKQKKVSELKKRHTSEEENLMIDRETDFDNLNTLWNQKFQELQKTSQNTLEELKNRHEKEFQELYNKYQNSIDEIKPSLQYLKYKKEEEGLVDLRKFKEAEIVRRKKKEQIEKDLIKTRKNKEISFINEEKFLKKKHNKELLYLQKKIQAEFDELALGKQREMEFLDKKYSAKRSDLSKQQKLENIVNNNKNYAKRIASLLINDDSRVCLKSRIQTQPNKDVEEIFTEVKENKLNNIDNAITNILENEKENEINSNKKQEKNTTNEKNNEDEIESDNLLGFQHEKLDVRPNENENENEELIEEQNQLFNQKDTNGVIQPDMEENEAVSGENDRDKKQIIQFNKKIDYNRNKNEEYLNPNKCEIEEL